MFHGRHFVRHLGICNPICVKLLQAMSGVIPRNLDKKNDVSTSNRFSGNHTRHTQTHTYTHTNTHVDSNRRNSMRCISPTNLCCNAMLLLNYGLFRHTNVRTNKYSHTHIHHTLHTDIHAETQQVLGAQRFY